MSMWAAKHIEAANEEARSLTRLCPSCRARLSFGDAKCGGCGADLEQLKIAWEEERDRICERLARSDNARGPSWSQDKRLKRNQGRLRPWGD